MELAVICNLICICLLITGCNASYVSYKKTVTSKSVDPGSPVITTVTDGDDTGDCFKSGNSYQEWIIIDMDMTYIVSSVTVINLAESVSGTHLQMKDAEVQIGSDSTVSNGVLCGTPANETQLTTSPIIDFTCSPPIPGRYLRLWFSAKSEHLNVCEVRIYDEDQLGIGECSEPPLRINYYGFVENTMEGILCQEWAVDTPHGNLIIVPSSYMIHNLCRNPDYDPIGPWCYTVDPTVRFSYCDVPTVDEQCPLEPFTGDLYPIGRWSVDELCLLSAYAELVFPVLLIELAVNETKTECLVEIESPLRFVMTMDYEHFGNEVKELTIALTIYAYKNSSGNILTFGNSNERVYMNQTYSDSQMYHSEVTVCYGEIQLTRAHVLLPEVWTFLALTFDGANRNIKLWRNGEVASIGYVPLPHLNLITEDVDLQVGSIDSGFRAKLGLLHVYNRILNEAEMKAARDTNIELGPRRRQGMFKKTMSPLRSLTKKTERVIMSMSICSQVCIVDPLCQAFGFDKETRLCQHLREFEAIDETSSLNYYHKIVDKVATCDCETKIETDL